MSFRIIGTGSALPEYALTNHQLADMVATSDEWIYSRTGIRNRYICTHEPLTDIATLAAKRALEQAGVAASELDLIICATMQGDFVIPALACMIQKQIGANCPAFDVNGACAGFVFAMDVAASYFARKGVEKVLVVAADAMSKYIDWNNRATCVLFGDGASAVLLTKGDNLIASKLTTEGSYEHLYIGTQQSQFPQAQPVPHKPTMEMNGKEVYRFAVNTIEKGIKDVLAIAGLNSEDLRYILLHQANMRIIEAATEKLGVDKEKVPSNVEKFGNSSSAGIAILLDEMNRAGQFREGDLLALCAFGSGLNTGSMIVRW